jgi:hypothetical protein
MADKKLKYTYIANNDTIQKNGTENLYNLLYLFKSLTKNLHCKEQYELPQT